MNQYEYNGIKRISKKAAEKLYNAGKPVYMLPCKMRFNNTWQKPYKAQKENSNEAIAGDGFNTIIPRNNEFETIVNAFTYYNCQYNETGKYIAYYIEMEE